jgi:hypothetical protein
MLSVKISGINIPPFQYLRNLRLFLDGTIGDDLTPKCIVSIIAFYEFEFLIHSTVLEKLLPIS